MLLQLLPALAGSGLLPGAASAVPQLSRAISGWNLYSMEKRGEVEAQLGTQNWDQVQKQVSQQWGALPKPEKAEYNRRGQDILPAKKRAGSSWNFFTKERSRKVLDELKAAGAEGHAVALNLQVNKQLSEEWKALSDADKRLYKEKAQAAAREEAKAELKAQLKAELKAEVMEEMRKANAVPKALSDSDSGSDSDMQADQPQAAAT